MTDVLHAVLGKGDHRRSVFLAGSGRGGTTWVSGMINHRNTYRFVFEPFHPGKVRMVGHFRRKQYLRPGDRREEYLGPARTVLTVGLRSLWADRFNRKLLARSFRLIKDIRTNLLFGWTHRSFPGMPIVLLLRHPCAVATSRLALGWDDSLAQMMEQEVLDEVFLLPVEDEIRAARDPFEHHLFAWCVEDHVPLSQFRPGEIQLAFYENFLAHPGHELGRQFSFLGQDLDERVYRVLARPSPLSHEVGSFSIDGWQRFVDGHRLRRAIEILALFWLDRVYGEGPMPDPSAAQTLLDTARR